MEQNIEFLAVSIVLISTLIGLSFVIWALWSVFDYCRHGFTFKRAVRKTWNEIL